MKECECPFSSEAQCKCDPASKGCDCDLSEVAKTLNALNATLAIIQPLLETHTTRIESLESQIGAIEQQLEFLKTYKYQQRVLLLDPATGKPYNPPRISTKRNGKPNIELFGVGDPLDIIQYEAKKKE